MLKTISPLISPELLKVLAEMGHGDEIIFSDAHFPAHSMGPQVIRADGLLVSDLPCPDIIRINRFAFYERAQKAFAIVITGERAKYGNILLKKGVTP